MTATAEAVLPPRSHNLPDDVMVLVAENPGLPLTDHDVREALFDAVEQQVAQFVADVKTEAGRKDISRRAREIGSLKTRIDDAGKDMTEGWRRQTNAVNAERNVVKSRLEALRDRLEKPLADWKRAEDQRQSIIRNTIDAISNSTQGLHAIPASAIALRIEQVEATRFDPAIFIEGTMAAEDTRAAALSTLRDAHAAAQRHEQQEAELRAARERAAELEREQAERVAEAERTAAAERARAEAAERDAAAEREQRIAEERAREQAREQEKARQRDVEHRTRIQSEAAAGLMAATGLSEGRAVAIVTAIAAGNVPHVAIQF